MRKPCVMVLATEGVWCGAPDLHAQVSVHLNRIGYRVIHGVLADGDGTLLSNISGIESLEAFSLRITKGTPWRAFDILPILDEEKPGLIIANLFHSYMLARLLGRMLHRIPVVSVLHSSEQGIARTILERMTLGFTEYFVAVSEEGAKYARETIKVPDRKLKVISPGVDFERIVNPSMPREAMRRSLGYSESDFVIGCVARFHPVKDHPTLLRAFKLLNERRPEARLLLVGGGEDFNKISALAETLGLLGKVRFTGYRRDVPDLYNAMDAYCLTSKREGMPQVILEAMAAGVPVVATEAPGIISILRHEANSLLAPIGDAESIAGALEAIAAQPGLAATIACAARKDVERHSLAFYLEQYQELVESIIGPPLSGD